MEITVSIEYFKNTDLIPESALEFIQFANIGDCYVKFGSQTSMKAEISLPPEELYYLESMKK